jgi:outer membrane protein
MKIVKICTILLLLPLSSSFALSLDEALKIAQRQNRGLKGSRIDVQQNKYNTWSSFGSLLPKVNLSTTMVHLDPNTFDKMKAGYNFDYSRYIAETALGIPSMPPSDVFQRTYTTQLSVTQPIWNGGSYWLGYKQSSESYNISKTRFDLDSLNLEYKVANLYFSILKVQELVRVNEQSLVSSRASLSTVKSRISAGVARESDRLQYDVKILEKESDLLLTKNNLEILKKRWADLLGLKSEDTLPSPDTISFSPYQGEIEKYSGFSIEEAEKEWQVHQPVIKTKNQNLKILDGNINLSSIAYKTQLGAFSPTLNLSWVKTIEKDEKFNFQGSDSWSLALTLSVPLFKGTSRIWNTKKARLALEKSRLTREDAEVNLLTSAKSSFLSMITYAKQVKIASAALQNAKVQYIQIQDQYRAGLATSTNLIDADLMLYSSQMRFA